MKDNEIYKSLTQQSTLVFVGLSIITLGIYFAHYVNRQTKVLNNYLDDSKKISSSFINTFFFIVYTSAVIYVFNLFFQNDIVSTLEGIINLIFMVMLITWGFKARNRVNEIMAYNKDEYYWFHGFWTIFFIPYYFNYKVNCNWDEIRGIKSPDLKAE